MIHLPSGVDKKKLIDDLRIFGWEASDTLLYYAQILKDANYKSNIISNNNFEDPVTLADLKVNEIIISKIRKNYKNVDWEILSEENVKTDCDSSFIKNDWVWVLDPLDGTKDFIQGTGNYAMHLALNYKKIPYLGIVLIPEKDELWISDGEKSWCENRNGLRFIPRLSKGKSLQKMVLVTSKNHNNQTLRKLIQKINFCEVIIMGSIGCKIASILRSESDIYISLSLPGESSPKDWDFAAPEVLLRKAGGAITKIDNKNLSYGNPCFEQGGIIVATNNLNLHESICVQIKEIIEIYNIYPLSF